MQTEIHADEYSTSDVNLQCNKFSITKINFNPDLDALSD